MHTQSERLALIIHEHNMFCVEGDKLSVSFKKEQDTKFVAKLGTASGEGLLITEHELEEEKESRERLSAVIIKRIFQAGLGVLTGKYKAHEVPIPIQESLLQYIDIG